MELTNALLQYKINCINATKKLGFYAKMQGELPRLYTIIIYDFEVFVNTTLLQKFYNIFITLFREFYGKCRICEKYKMGKMLNL